MSHVKSLFSRFLKTLFLFVVFLKSCFLLIISKRLQLFNVVITKQIFLDNSLTFILTFPSTPSDIIYVQHPPPISPNHFFKIIFFFRRSQKIYFWQINIFFAHIRTNQKKNSCIKKFSRDKSWDKRNFFSFRKMFSSEFIFPWDNFPLSPFNCFPCSFECNFLPHFHFVVFQPRTR